MSFSRHQLALILGLALAGCASEQGPGVNPYVGCYDNSCVDRPQDVPTVPALVAISTKASHVCGIAANGDAWCWGDNAMGQLGDSSSAPRSGPVKVAGGIQFKAITVGVLFSCGLALDGTAYCWGLGAGGALAQTPSERCGATLVHCATAPLAIAGHTFVDIAAGFRHVCAVDTGGAAWCWGFNFFGETGSDAYATTLTTPTLVAGSANLASVGAGDSFTCALTSAGQAQCWGSGNRGELGRAVSVCGSVAGVQTYCTPTPGAANTSASFTSLSVGNSHVCGLTADGAAFCWGDNGQAQLGRGNYGPGPFPDSAHKTLRFAAINASQSATCATPLTGPSVCWGLNLMGKLGVGSNIELSEAPLTIFGAPRYLHYAGGAESVCGITDSGAAQCWGSGRFGQLGSGPMLP